MGEICLSFLFFVMFLCSLSIRVMVASKNIFIFFWKIICIIGIIFPLSVWKDLPVKQYESEVFFVQMFSKPNSVFYKDIGYLFLLECALVVYVFWGIGHVSKLLNFFCLKLFISFYCPLNISGICNYVTSLIPDTGLPYVCLLTFITPDQSG